MDYAALDFFDKMSEQELMDEIVLSPGASDASWYNTLFGTTPAQQLELQPLRTPTQPLSGIHELPSSTVDELQEVDDLDLQMIDDFGDRLAVNEEELGVDLDALAWDAPVAPGEVEMGDLNAEERAGLKDTTTWRPKTWAT